eukprot:6097522-Amphidinium_carterae.1
MKDVVNSPTVEMRRSKQRLRASAVCSLKRARPLEYFVEERSQGMTVSANSRSSAHTHTVVT